MNAFPGGSASNVNQKDILRERILFIVRVFRHNTQNIAHLRRG
jgi:hypothetical protein